MARVDLFDRYQMKIRVGTRSSDLALAQTEIFKRELLILYPYLEIEIVKIKTTGDILYDTPLTEIGGKALFIKEIEEALLRNEIDCAVHSMKDMPVSLPNGVIIGCVLKRENCEDAFVSLKCNTIDELPNGSVIGTCSSRRKVLLQRYNPNLLIKDLRGNVMTRLKKLECGEVDAIILAVAGLKRLIKSDYIKEVLHPERFIPAIAQGIICIEVLKDNVVFCDMLSKLNHRETYISAVIERKFLELMGGDCRTPIGMYTILNGNRVFYTAFTFMNNIYREYKNFIELDNNDLNFEKIHDTLNLLYLK